MKTRVINLHYLKTDYANPNYIYIGRPSKWGNPFQIGKDGTREEVIEKYRNYILNNTELLNDIDELRNKTLGCYCKPKKCHGDILVELIELLDELLTNYWMNY